SRRPVPSCSQRLGSPSDATAWAGGGVSPLSDVARTRLRRGGVALAALVVLASPWWARLIAAQLSFFRVRRVEIVGVKYLAPSDILGRLRVDTTRSVWDDL